MGRTIGIIGDTHLPFMKDGYLEFCQQTFNTFSVDEVIHIGDEVDNSAISYHEKQTGMPNADSEMDQAMRDMKRFYRAFPDVKVCVGNHSALPFRKATTAGIPTKMLKTYEDMWEAPKGWKWELNFTIDEVLYTHGIGAGGQNGALKLAMKQRQSTVIGHSHAFGGVGFSASYRDLIWGMNVGCGVDIDHLAMSYGKDFASKPTLGCGIVADDGRTPLFIPMPLGDKIKVI
jgi:predicted phosphodiesterase